MQEKSIDDTSELSGEDKRKLKILKLEHYLLVSEGIESVPESVSDEEWMYLLKSCPTEAIRLKRYKVLFWQQKREIEKQEMAVVEEKAETEALEEGSGYTNESFKNQLLLHVQRTRVNLFQYNNMYYSMINGPHLVFDCSFEKHMKDRYLKSVITQIGFIYGKNKATNEPFHLHFCNVPLDGQTQVLLAKHFGDMLSQIPITITHKSYLDCYSKERLVYLSPDAPTIMEKYNPDDVYIIGCIEDGGLLKRYTADKAKKENIRTMRFPIDQYVRLEASIFKIRLFCAHDFVSKSTIK